MKKRIFAVFTALFLILSGLSGISVHAENEDAGIAAGIYTIAPYGSTDRVLGISGTSGTSGTSGSSVSSATASSKDSGAKLELQSPSGASSQKFVVTPLGNGLYSIYGYGSGLSLDVVGNGKTNGTRIQQYRRNRSEAQRFSIRKDVSGACSIVASGSGLVFDLQFAATTEGTPVQIYESNGTNAQKFVLTQTSSEALTSGTYTIHTSYADSKVLDIAAGSTSAGGNLQIYESNGSAAQQYTLTALSGGSFLISPVCSALALDVAAASAQNGANVQQYTPNNSAAQRWKITPTQDGYYQLSPECATGSCLDIAGASSANGANAQIYSSNNSAAQKFSFESTDSRRTVPSGAFLIASSLDSSKVLDVADASVKNGGNIQIYQMNSSAAQKYILSYQGSGLYKITCACSSKVLDVAGGSPASGANVQQYESNDSAAQRWSFISNGDGTFTVRSALGTVLDIAGGSTANGTNVQAYASNGSGAQKFTLIPTTATPYTPTKSKLVAIDAGHQLHANTGTEPIGPGSSTMKQKVASGTYGVWSGLNEYQLNLDVALKLEAELESRGYSVYMIRTTNNVDISNAQRAQMATAAGADILVRIHANSVDSSSVSGALCYQPSSSNPYLSASVIAGSQRLSQCLVNGECAATGLKNRGLLDGDDMTGINWATMPVSIVEMGFMSNQGDDLYMASASGQAAIVQGLANGIDAYFG